MQSNRASAFFLHGIKRVGAACRAVGFVWNVGGFPEDLVVGGRHRHGLFVLNSPLQLGVIDVPAVDSASALPCRFNAVLKPRHGDGRENPDNRDHNHDFNESKRSLFCLHTILNRSRAKKFHHSERRGIAWNPA